MLSVLNNPTYRNLFSAQVIALLGTGLLTVALGLLAFVLLLLVFLSVALGRMIS